MKRRKFFGVSTATVLMFGTGVSLVVPTRAYASGNNGTGNDVPVCRRTFAVAPKGCSGTEGTACGIHQCIIIKKEGPNEDCSPARGTCYAQDNPEVD
jgi:hypothetical protein